VFNVYADGFVLESLGSVEMNSAESAILNATGAETTVNIVETPCDLTVNTTGGNDVIQVGVLFENQQENITGVATTDGWLSAGATHKLSVNTGDGDDLVTLHAMTGEMKFSGGEGDDKFYIQQYRYVDRYEKHPIGEFGAYADVETAIFYRLIDKYIVVEEDNLTEIAELFGVTVEDLIAWNGEQIQDPDLIFPGQELIVGPYSVEEEIILDRIA
jgi:hypothetical protein